MMTLEWSSGFQKTGCLLALDGVSHAARQLAQSEYGRQETECHIVFKFPMA